jgi:subfamily B ATP-binding cassette protein MsbA
MKRFLKLLKYIFPYKKQVFAHLTFNIMSVFFSLFSITMAIPFMNILFQKDIRVYAEDLEPFALNANSLEQHFYYFLTNIIETNGEKSALLIICIVVVTMFMLKNLTIYFANFYIAPVRNGVVKDIRNNLFAKILVLPLSFYSKTRRGDIMSRMSTDVQEIEFSIMSSLEMLFRAPINIIVFLSTLFIISYKLTFFVIFILPISAFVISRVAKSLKRTARQGQKKIGKLMSIVQETLSGIKVVKAFNGESYAFRVFKSTNEIYTNKMIRMFRKRYLAGPISEFLGTVVMVLVMWFGGSMVLDASGELSPSAFIGYLIIFSQIISPAKGLSNAFFNVQKGMASLERIEYILNEDEKITDKDDAKDLKDFTSSIKYENVSFGYEDELVLKNINLNIEKGKTIAVVGHSGSGKTTLADLLPRFFDVTKGAVKIDDIDIRDYKITDLRNLLGIVTQESILFHDTFYKNIAFGQENVDEEKVVEAAKVANADEFISKKGYDMVLGDDGKTISGGQRQRVSIARAILKNPPILILDEATSSLDTESERLVQDALNHLMANRTSIVIAHRLSTVQHADEIIVLNEGEIVERGTHLELIKLEGFYKKLSDMQSFS